MPFSQSGEVGGVNLMVASLIPLLVLVLIMLLVLWILGKFLPAVAVQVVGLIFGILLLIRILAIFGVALP